MYPITESLKMALDANQYQEAIISFEGLDEDLFLSNSDIISGGLSVDRYCITGDKFEIGSAVASELSLSLNNRTGRFNNVRFEGAELYVTVKIYISDTEFEIVPLGYFTVDSAPEMSNTIAITALDRMMMFSNPVDAALLSFPIKIGNLLEQICNICNVSLATIPSSLLNYDYEISAIPTEENMTYRTLLQWIAEITCTYAYIDYEGRLRLEWYDGNTETALTPSVRYSSKLNEQAIVITGVQIKSSDSLTYLSGEKGYVVEIRGNGLIQAGQQILADNIGTRLIGFTYTPFTAETKPYPHLFPTDKVMFTDKNENTIHSVITHVTYKMNGKTAIESKGETATIAGYASGNPLTRQETAIIEIIKNSVNETLNNRLQSILEFNELITNSMGLYKTQINAADNSTITYMHDKPTLESSMLIYTHTAAGFAYTNSGWNSGSPVWQYGFTKDGNAIFNKVCAYGLEVSDPNTKYSAKVTPEAFETYFGSMRTMSANGERSIFKKIVVEDYTEVGKIRHVPHYTNGTLVGTDIVYID